MTLLTELAPITPLTRLHRSTDPTLRAALAVIPGHEQLRDAVDRVRAHLEAWRPDHVHPAAALRDEISRALAAGGALPDDFERRAHDAVTAAERRKAARDVLAEIHAHLAADLDTLLHANLHLVFGALDQQLQDVLRQARALHLDVTNAEDAITAGKANAWQKRQKLLAWRNTLRSAQQDIVTAAGPIDADRFARFAWVEKYTDADPYWAARARGVAADRGLRTDLIPDPSDAAARFAFEVEHPELHPWIPSFDQLAGAEQAGTEAARRIADEFTESLDGGTHIGQQGRALAHRLASRGVL